ncbi:unnamed protein product [Nesidiocoris tenuis]|uniref:NIF3-like protein 1 n=1 Tax=Nesidiocoris tenuis TaxID=355587 RepID=A0A6H5GEK6_9HEMI|nr:unnamed protein product [Nesidiocoris tenuis]
MEGGEGLPLQDVVAQLERLADVRGAESWDNVGLLVEPFTPTVVKTILLTNDLTQPVMTEAIKHDVNLIVSYHPPLFAPIKRIGSASWKERLVAACLENRIAVYSPHTAWDAASGGVTDWLASAFDGHFDPAAVRPIIESNLDVAATPTIVGAGRHLITQQLTLSKCVELVKRRTGLAAVRLSIAIGKAIDSPVTSVGLVPGSGGSILKEVLSTRNSVPDLFVTGEMFHHDILDAAHAGVSVILTNHSDSERGFLADVAEKLRAAFGPNVLVLGSSADRDPLRTV